MVNSRPLSQLMHLDSKITGSTGDYSWQEQRKEYGARGNYSPRESFDFLQLIFKWPQIVGELLGKNSVPLRLNHQVLMVLTKHSLFSQEINNLSEIIIEKTEKIFPSLRGKIHKIRFCVSTAYFQQRIMDSDDLFSPEQFAKQCQKKVHPFSPEYKRAKSKALHFLQEVQAEIDDPELQEIFSTLFIQCSLRSQLHSQSDN